MSAVCGSNRGVKRILETKRLRLREFAEEDAESFYRLNSDPDVMRYTGDEALVSVEQARTILRDYPIADYREHGYGRWACVLRDTAEVIGFAGLKYLPERGEVDLGYRFLRQHWGRGLATEACRAVIAHGFDVLRLAEIAALVQTGHIASMRVLEKCGLTFSGTTEYGGRTVARYAITAPAQATKA